MTKLFISYAHDDKHTVLQLVKRLQTQNFEIWIDVQDLRGGELWSPKIVQAIRESNFFLLLISSKSIESDNVRREVDVAYNYRDSVKIIPIRLEKVDIPLEWAYQVAGIQWIEYEEKNWETKLLQTLRRSRDGAIEQHTTPNSSLNLVEKELRMNKSHWINAGFSIPAKNFNFTVVYFANHIEVLRNLRNELQNLIEQVKANKINPALGSFCDDAYEVLNQIDKRVTQVQDILESEKEHPLSITIQKAAERLLECSTNAREAILQSSMTGVINLQNLDNAIDRLGIEFHSVLIAIQEIERQIEQIYHLNNAPVQIE